MKRVGNRWEQLCSVQTGIEAIIHGTENKRFNSEVLRRYGYTDGAYHNGELDPDRVKKGAEHLASIYQKGWMPAPLRRKSLKMPGQKQRLLGIPTLTDHLLGWMLILTIQDIICRGMHPFCCGSIPGRGIEYARAAVARWTQHDPQTKYFVKLDIRHYYENIDNELLKQDFRRVIKDKRLLTVIDQHIDSGLSVMDTDGNLIPDCTGQPVGTYPSPWFANFYLQSLDHYVTQELYKERRGKRKNLVTHYLRYIDDILMTGTSKRDLEKAVRATIDYCRDKRNLEVKTCWEICEVGEMTIDENGDVTLRPGTCPVDIVGYKFYRKQVVVRGKNFLHTSRLATKIQKRLVANGSVLVHDAQAVLSLTGWFEHADSTRFFQDNIGEKISLDLMKEVVSYASRNRIIGEAACVYCGKRERDGKYHILYGHPGGTAKRRDGVRGDIVDDAAPLL